MLFEQYSVPVFGYARRHSDASVAEDVASETFLIAWRRRDDIPGDPLPWLLVVARNVLANRRRALSPAQSLRVDMVAAGLIGAAATALLVIGLVLPSGLPGGSQNAGAAVEQLAVAAGTTPADTVRPGQYRHLIDRENQGGSITVLESWTSYDGHTWRHDTEHATSQYYAFPPGISNLNDPSPKFLASLPTDTTDLDTYMRAHVTGSTSVDEAVFVAVGDMLRGGFAPPALRAAAIRVLGRTGHISAETTQDSLGRAAVKITFTDRVRRPGGGQSLLFDPKTSALLEEQEGPGFTATYTDEGTVNSVPADVVANAKAVFGGPGASGAVTAAPPPAPTT